MTPPSPWSENVERVRAGIAIHPDEPTDVMVSLEQNALAALVALTAQMEEMERERDEGEVRWNAAEQRLATFQTALHNQTRRAEAAEAHVEEMERNETEGAAFTKDLERERDTLFARVEDLERRLTSAISAHRALELVVERYERALRGPENDWWLIARAAFSKTPEST